MGLGKSKLTPADFPEDIREKYKIGPILGVGTFGQVRDCVRQDPLQEFAVKIIDQNSSAIAWGTKSVARLEADLLATLNHPNIVKFIDVYEDAQFLYVIMEKCTGGEVFEKLVKQKRFTESEMVGFCRQVFSAIEYIHARDIIHRDIKAENFLYASDGSVKLIDFGLAVKVKTPKQVFVDIVGSPHYMAPEMLERRYSYGVDMWSAGVLVYLMLFGRYPFEGDTDELILRRVRIGGVNWASADFTPSADILTFLMRLLEVDPAKRMTPLEALNEQFLRYKASTEQHDGVMVSELVAEKLNSSVVIPAMSRRKELMNSPAEQFRSARILELERQFDAGLHRGWRKSTGWPASAPTSPHGAPRSPIGRQGAKGFTGFHTKALTLSLIRSPEPVSPVNKRSHSLPGSRVTFDVNPPQIFVYTDGVSGVMKVAPDDQRKQRKL